MMEGGEFEGSGYHFADTNEDCLLVSQWIKRPGDVTGSSLPISKLLPKSVRCQGSNTHIIPYATFKLHIIVEIEEG